MSIEKVKIYFDKYNLCDKIIEFSTSSATVELAAKAIGCADAQIAKSLTFMVNDKPIMIVTAGDAKIDNRKYKDKFETKAKMMTPDQVNLFIGHEIGGVCPFGIPSNVKVYCDISMKRFEFMYPAAGSSNSAIKLDIESLFKFSNTLEWVDICKDWQGE